MPASSTSTTYASHVSTQKLPTWTIAGGHGLARTSGERPASVSLASPGASPVESPAASARISTRTSPVASADASAIASTGASIVASTAAEPSFVACVSEGTPEDPQPQRTAAEHSAIRPEGRMRTAGYGPTQADRSKKRYSSAFCWAVSVVPQVLGTTPEGDPPVCTSLKTALPQ